MRTDTNAVALRDRQQRIPGQPTPRRTTNGPAISPTVTFHLSFMQVHVQLWFYRAVAQGRSDDE